MIDGANNCAYDIYSVSDDDFARMRHVSVFHMVAEGRCTMQTEEGETFHLEAGDLVLMPFTAATLSTDLVQFTVPAETSDTQAFSITSPGANLSWSVRLLTASSWLSFSATAGMMAMSRKNSAKFCWRWGALTRRRHTSPAPTNSFHSMTGWSSANPPALSA